MFGFYRASHEIDRLRMHALAAGVLTGELDVGGARVRAELRRRSVRFHLEVDVAGHMAVFAGTHAGMYADAKFVLLMRDCFSWLNSVVDQRLRSIRELRNNAYFHAKFVRYGYEFSSAEAVLRDAELVPVAAYLRAWAETSRRVLEEVPPERLLVVRTEDLDHSVEALARFAGVPESTVQPVHANRNPSPTGLLSEVPASFVIERAREHCAPLMERFWGPGWCDLVTRLPQQRIR
jgi:Sulfotransferase domain